MSHAENSKNVYDKRKYHRLDTLFPVSFTIVRLQEDILGIDWLKGYTQNVGKGGMCLETSDLTKPVIKFMFQQSIFLELHILIRHPPLKAIGEVIWYKKVESENPNHYMIGLKFYSISEPDLNRILGDATRFTVISRLAVVLFVIVFFILIAIGIHRLGIF